ncbi:MAG: T9SS type A sorting domain-containing protein, partial [Bacteroidales bacterium]|nr:T9SS type A sorting domain-containing protein [Bacteroidales bacterium]
ENLHVAGEYRTLFITDLAGKRVGKVLENAETVSMTALQSGVYLLHFTLVDGRNLVVKVVKR